MKLIRVKCKDEFSPSQMEEQIHEYMKRASHITQQLDPNDKRYRYAREILEDLGFVLKKKVNNLGTMLEEWVWDKK